MRQRYGPMPWASRLQVNIEFCMYLCYLNVDKVLCFFNEITICSMNAIFTLTGSGRPLADTSDNLHTIST